MDFQYFCLKGVRLISGNNVAHCFSRFLIGYRNWPWSTLLVNVDVFLVLVLVSLLHLLLTGRLRYTCGSDLASSPLRCPYFISICLFFSRRSSDSCLCQRWTFCSLTDSAEQHWPKHLLLCTITPFMWESLFHPWQYRPVADAASKTSTYTSGYRLQGEIGKKGFLIYLTQ